MITTFPTALPRMGRAHQKPHVVANEPLSRAAPETENPLTVEAPLQVQMPNPFSGALAPLAPAPRSNTDRTVTESSGAGLATG